MRIYFAAFGSDSMSCLKYLKSPNLLFSFYDLTIGTFGFRKKSYDIIKEMKGEKKCKSKKKN